MKLSGTQIKNLIILAIAQFFCLSLWFSTNAILSQIRAVFMFTSGDVARISSAVVFGFVIGGLISSVLNISDIVSSTRVFFLSAILGSTTNTIITITGNITVIIISRFFTGFFLAGIYPIGMKLTASHFKENRGLSIGILLSALTAGSGLPYLFNLIGVPDWRVLVFFSSVLAAIGGGLVLVFCSEGPFIGKSANFSISNLKTIYSNQSVRQANYGYFGHMWELYAFWVWIPIYLEIVYLRVYPSRDPLGFVSLVTFAIFVTGAISNIGGGYISDRIGRTTFNIIMLSASGLSSLVIGLFLDNLILAVITALIWGLTIIPDSPQYSSMVTELADENLVGSALTLQTAIGFSLTIVSIRIIPIFVEIVGWQWVFTSLTIGPVLGIISLVRLRQNPDSIKIAGGNK